jgi:hypothetical protein
MARNQFDETFDDEFILKDAGLVAADAAAQVAAADKVVDLGLSRVDGRVIVQITAIEVADNNEKFDIITQFSNSATFASGVVNGPALVTGASEVTKASADTAVGTYELPFASEVNGTLYRYMRLWTEVTGTVGTGINYTARGVKKA